MSLHRLSAGAGYAYLLRHTACGDVQRAASTPLTAYYTESGYPPGRWFGAGLAGLNAGRGLKAGSPVSEPQMAALFGNGTDPVTGAALGRAYPVFASLTERIAARLAALPSDLEPGARADRVTEIERAERARRTPSAVAGFDLTFTVPKSASVLWALADPQTQAAVAAAHRAAVEDALEFLQDRALFTRTGAAGCAQVATRGMIAACFDHWDTRTGDPNLHTHVVIANKVQGPDGVWRSLDSRALHHATVAVSEVYDDLLADHLAARLPVRWGWRHRGPRRTPAFEVDGIDDHLLAAFSTRSSDIQAAMRGVLADFHAAHGRGPTRTETVRLRQQVTRATRPAKTPHPLADLLARWKDQAQRLTGRAPQAIAEDALHGRPRPLRAGQLSPMTVGRLAQHVVDDVMARRSTWTSWNLLTEAARATRSLRMASTADRFELLDRVTAAALDLSVALDPPDPVLAPERFRRPDGSSVFTRPGEHAYSHRQILDAEQRLLDAITDTDGPVVPEATARRIAAAAQPTASATVARPDGRVRLASDQADAVAAIAASGRRLDVLIGPAGTGKTTTLRALRAAWESAHGRGSVLGLAPSATAAHELAAALGIACENTAKWLHETTGPGGTERAALLTELTRRRAAAVSGGTAPAVRRIDAAIAALHRDQRRWSLRPGQLLIVDEASLAGTLALDDLSGQAVAAGAKLLLVGDHHQLCSVDAGGAFGLLAECGAGVELTSLWRFRHRWEAWAIRRLRHGDPDVLAAYADHGRIQAGAAEAMLEAAYTAWQASEHAGRSAVLIAADTHSVDALNARAHDDRVRDGLVKPGGVPLGPTGERGRVGVGDRVLTRRNDRHLAVPGRGHVRNGALWTVLATWPDGSLTASPADRHTTHPGRPDPATAVVLPAGYVNEHVDLGYATTAHRAQGLTVEDAHVLAAPGMTREALYVAMTRGRDTNTVYVATDVIDPACDQLPDGHPEPDGVDVLTSILATSGAQLSATQTMATRREAAVALRRLAPIRETLAADADRALWQPLLTGCGLTTEQAERVLASPALGALLAALREGDSLGHSMRPVLARLVRERALDQTDDAAHDLAAVLHARVDRWLATAPNLAPSAPATTGWMTGASTPSWIAGGTNEDDDGLAPVDRLITDRVAAVTTAAVTARPYWLLPLDGPCAEARDRQTWREQISCVAAYRDLTGTTADSPLGPDQPTDTVGRRRRRIAGHAAWRAHRLTHPHDDRIPAR